mmetsp:Transcript_13991/g.25299  ORF Transcript_13991/g.25299 Transcript_13991/m.25299 type:complete len:87 (+) Transcript_13991:130-390(+)
MGRAPDTNHSDDISITPLRYAAIVVSLRIVYLSSLNKSRAVISPMQRWEHTVAREPVSEECRSVRPVLEALDWSYEAVLQSRSFGN